MGSSCGERPAKPSTPHEVTMKVDIESLLEDLTSGDDTKAELAAISLSVIGNDAIPALRKNLKSKNADDRWWAVRTLAEMNNPPVDLLIKSLEDDSQEVQQCGTLALCHHPDNRAIPKLLKLLQTPDTVTSNLAASALIAIGNESIPGLLSLFSELKDVSKIEATRAIACIEDPRAIPILMQTLDEDSLASNYWAEEGLNRLGLSMVYMKPE